MNDLPNGWAYASVEELAGAEGLTTDGDWIETKDQDPNGDVRLIQLADVGDGEFRDRSARFVTSDTARRLNCTFLNKDDLLIARMADPLGRACIFPGVEQTAITAVDVFIWRPVSGGPSARWLMHFMNSPDVRNSIAEEAGGTTRQRIAGGRVKRLTIPLPPLPEQRRMVTKIDSLSVKSSRARDHLDHIPRLVEKYKETILWAATRGALTEQWRVVNHASAWTETTVDQISSIVFDGPFGSNLKSADYTPLGARVVRLENIGHLEFIDEKKTYISLKKLETLKRHVLKAYDVLFSSFVDDQVRVCLMPSNYQEPTINKADCFCIRANREQCDPQYLAYRLACPSTYEEFKEVVHGATRPRITLSQLKAHRFTLPSLAEQSEINHRIDIAFAWIDRLAREASNARKLIDHLHQTVLAKAFRGELVPQDQNDEPASILLERIRAARAGIQATRQAKRRSLAKDESSLSAK